MSLRGSDWQLLTSTRNSIFILLNMILTLRSPNLNLVHLSDVVLTHAVKLAGSGFQCGLCSYTSERKYNMRLHLDGSHGLGWGRYQCDRCHQQLKTQARLTQHKLVCSN